MEEVLTTLSRDATSGKLKSVRDACNAATGKKIIAKFFCAYKTAKFFHGIFLFFSRWFTAQSHGHKDSGTL